jgi:cell fate regulator YaaT (PSP1 superfamily)
MPSIVGVRYKRAGRIYYFDPMGIELAPGNEVVVETSRGLEIGRVVVAPAEVAGEEIVGPLKPVKRRATEEDITKAEQLEDTKMDALAECGKLIDELKLPMKLIDADVNLENSRLTVYFGAESRVDFRELVRELSRRLKMRVEMRQVGPRDEAKMVGGFGRCGRQLCCQGFMSEFSPVSIKMAKAQNLPLNPMKISGICSRLLCCLGYEYEQYCTLRQEMPKEGKQVTTPKGEATVIGGNLIEEKVLVEFEGGNTASFHLAEVSKDTEVLADKKKTTKEVLPEKREVHRDSDRHSRKKKE